MTNVARLQEEMWRDDECKITYWLGIRSITFIRCNVQFMHPSSGSPSTVVVVASSSPPHPPPPTPPPSICYYSADYLVVCLHPSRQLHLCIRVYITHPLMGVHSKSMQVCHGWVAVHALVRSATLLQWPANCVVVIAQQ